MQGSRSGWGCQGAAGVARWHCWGALPAAFRGSDNAEQNISAGEASTERECYTYHQSYRKGSRTKDTHLASALGSGVLGDHCWRSSPGTLALGPVLDLLREGLTCPVVPRGVSPPGGTFCCMAVRAGLGELGGPLQVCVPMLHHPVGSVRFTWGWPLQEKAFQVLERIAWESVGSSSLSIS